MLEVGGGPDLAQEPLGPDHGGQLGSQHLDRDLAVVPQILREVDCGYASLAQLALDAVAVGEGGRERRRENAHGPTRFSGRNRHSEDSSPRATVTTRPCASHPADTMS